MPRTHGTPKPAPIRSATALLLCLACAALASGERGGPSGPPAAPPPVPPPDATPRAGHYVASPEGPRDGGDFGPHTPGTRTSGLQEAFDACRRDRRDLYIVGGAVPAPFENPGGVYILHETLRIPWMQDFRCDGGEAVLQYAPEP